MKAVKSNEKFEKENKEKPTQYNLNKLYIVYILGGALYHEPLAPVIAQALPLFDINLHLHSISPLVNRKVFTEDYYPDRVTNTLLSLLFTTKFSSTC